MTSPIKDRIAWPDQSPTLQKRKSKTTPRWIITKEQIAGILELHGIEVLAWDVGDIGNFIGATVEGNIPDRLTKQRKEAP